MNPKRLLKSGYFPKELPPPFQTVEFSNKAQYIHRKWQSLLTQKKIPQTGESQKAADRRFKNDYTDKYGSSGFQSYSYTKNIYSRRKLGIVNPKQFHDLCNLLNTKWPQLNKILKSSKFSASTPTEDKSSLRSVRTKSKSLSNFQFELIEKSFNKKFELRLDISQFYPTIYTHSLTWAILGIKDAKKYFKLSRNKAAFNLLTNTDRKAKLYAFCDLLDTLVRNCQDRQSIGLPIGPDTSFILAELIGNRIDSEISSRISNINFTCLRYYDDYYFYTDTHDDAEMILQICQQILNEFHLETNESKVKIKRIPFTFEPSWYSELISFKFSKVDEFELRNYFSILFKLIENNPTESSWIISYGLLRFEFGRIIISKKDWTLFFNLLVKTLLIDTSNIDQFLKLLLSYKAYMTKSCISKLSEVLLRLLQDHNNLGHHFEVSWILWIIKTFKIKCPREIIKNILEGDDYISMIICLDIINSGLCIGRRIPLRLLQLELNIIDLWNEKWLFVYESLIKGWLSPPADFFDKHEYFKILNYYNISFYDSSRQISPNFLTDQDGNPSTGTLKPPALSKLKKPIAEEKKKQNEQKTKLNFKVRDTFPFPSPTKPAIEHEEDLSKMRY